MTQPAVPSSRLAGFYQKSVAARTDILAHWAELTPEETNTLHDGLSVAQADKMIENVVGRYSLPLGIATNFRINGRDVLVPMVVEEPSVVAAVSFAAKLARGAEGGDEETPGAQSGFRTGSTEPLMIAQVQLLDVADFDRAEADILAARQELLALADTSPTIARLGGGPRDLVVRRLPQTPTIPMLIVHLHFDARDAMGANAVNTAAETIAPELERLSGGRALLRILSNLSDQRRAWAEVAIPAHRFDTQTLNGATIIQNIAHANAFAVADPYRAATHNKGIFNGLDAVALATGNDWRAIEAGAHAWAARDGQYRALTTWRVEQGSRRAGEQGSRGAGEQESRRAGEQGSRGAGEQGSRRAGEQESRRAGEQGSRRAGERESRGAGEQGSRGAGEQGSRGAGERESKEGTSFLLRGRLELPLAVGTVGGATRAHPAARVALKILGLSDGERTQPGSARELSEIMAAVGLAQNLAALRALATEGIQRGHMSLHARQIAVAAGASGAEVDRVAARLVELGEIRVERAREILKESNQ